MCTWLVSSGMTMLSPDLCGAVHGAFERGRCKMRLSWIKSFPQGLAAIDSSDSCSCYHSQLPCQARELWLAFGGGVVCLTLDTLCNFAHHLTSSVVFHPREDTQSSPRPSLRCFTDERPAPSMICCGRTALAVVQHSFSAVR